MKLSDYVIQFLADLGIDHVFGLTGGAVVHLFDSADKSDRLSPVFCHHEQAAALAAVSYSRQRNSWGAAIVTTGPGGTNAVTGVLSAWQDSIPTLFVSGQSRLDLISRGKPVRQVGAQEFDILSIVVPITKYAAMVERAEDIRFHLEKAVHLAQSGRPGPVWIDIPVDLQWIDIDVGNLAGFSTTPAASAQKVLLSHVQQCCNLLQQAERPLLLVGYGVRLAHAEESFKCWLETVQIPFVSSWTASDIIHTDHPLYTGRIGMTGQRGGNLAVQNCDLLLCLGSHLSVPLTGTMFDAFAREAKIVLVDIDHDSLDHRTARADLCLPYDINQFLGELAKLAVGGLPGGIASWRRQCNHYKGYNVVPEHWREEQQFVNANVFIDVLSDLLDPGVSVVVDGGGTTLYTSFQSMKMKKGQRLLLSSGICAMGTGLPESVGACFAGKRRQTICLTGDGSIQLNIQELQTIVHHRLPVKIFVINNSGYLAIRHTQSAFLEKNYVGSSVQGGVSLPDFTEVAKAYGLHAIRIKRHSTLKTQIREVLSHPGPVLCEVMTDPDQLLIAQQGFDRRPDGTFAPRPLEDMFPYLDREEFLQNMIVTPWKRGD